jgi:hypothetical protein
MSDYSGDANLDDNGANLNNNSLTNNEQKDNPELIEREKRLDNVINIANHMETLSPEEQEAEQTKFLDQLKHFITEEVPKLPPEELGLPKKRVNKFLEDIGKYQQVSKILEYPKFLEKLVKLKNQIAEQTEEEQQSHQTEINELFKQAIELVTDKNVNNDINSDTLLKLAVHFDNIETIDYLIKAHLNTLKKAPAQLRFVIKYLAQSGYKKELESLLSDKDIINAVAAKKRYFTLIIKAAAKNNQTETLC